MTTFSKAGPAARVQHVRVGEEEAGRRLDNFLLGRLKGVPRSHVYRVIRSGEVRLNGRRARAAARIESGDEIRIPPVQVAAPGRPGPADGSGVDWIRERIRHMDRHLLVLDKPAGLAVHGGSGIRLGAIELLRAALDHGDDLELVHRLDRDTSGCLLFARRRSVLRALHAQFREGRVDKTYLALLAGGRWRGGAREVNAALETSSLRGGERHVRISPSGKPARTRFVPVSRFGDYTLVEVELFTGRTHQIRVHAASLGHPVAGDQRYGKMDQMPGHLPGRLFLHARSLAFEHPGTGERLCVQCPLPEEFARALQSLDNGS